MPDWLKKICQVTDNRFSNLVNLMIGALAVLAWQAIESGGDVFLGFLPTWLAWIFVIQGGIGVLYGVLQMVTRR